ncbi:MAG: hypothetical protein A3F83_12165 [Candidatus Glassbacteria bacterium RIFCSPLOWO2_12_FULL_58_11]|uniref:STAS domain-containing protein n=1 Tax=Candidatus Glassbacteria bacterium RIFCSPLOWO2_12_FULL_58_11 TaxID=1817867 RepID=A0A1F5YX69_9BACT|nr:MAG: hypothetical protein A3F83_12165 [Candidatus Glassbacteria bacterium RIFCSPLOWO2_12_FULL_58_11]
MADVINSLTDGVTFKAPAQMCGPKVHRLKMDIMASFKDEPKAIVIDFDEVDYIDLHGLVLFKDICDIIRVYGAQAFAYRLKAPMRDLLADLDLLSDLGSVQPESAALRSA